VQGSVAIAGADLNLSSLLVAFNDTQDIDFFAIALPTL
jgi:hypothetical protein